MKNRHTRSKTTLALALLALAGAASAQTSLTLFGVVDVGVRHASTDGVGHINSVMSGSYSSARYGFRGQEDLGGGLSASFWLESFLSADAGTMSPAGFQRRSTVSLAHTGWGELRLGRDYTPTHSSWARFDPFGYVGIGANQLLILSATGNTPVAAAFGTSPNTIQRASNTVQYLLPRNAWGLEGGLTYGFREDGTAATDQHKVVGGRLGITVGKLFVSAAALDTRNNLTTLGKFKDRALGASYDASVVKVSAAVRRLEYGPAQQTNTLLAASVPLGVHQIKVSWNRSNMDGRVGATSIDDNRTDQYALGYVYHLSKRSRIYGTYARMSNKGGARFVIPGAPAGPAGVSSKGFEAGINHEF